MDYVGSTLNKRYRLDNKVGEGGFASVFLAMDLELGRQVAVKILGQDWTRDKDLLTRFRNEARAIAVLDHPNILQIYDFGVAKGAPYLVMPYLSGGTLAARMKREPLTLDEIGFYLDQVGSALDYAHQHGIVHRDVKPANLLIRNDGQLVLMDFGLAKLLDNVALQASTLVLGTVAYMAPEQCLGMVSAASDTYMLGVILYQMLAGKLPYEGNTTQIMVGHVHAAPGSLIGQSTMQAVPQLVVQALDQVIMKVLAKAPADRYPTCQTLSFAYYNALKADPNRVARYHNRDKNLDVRQLRGTIIEGKQRVMPATQTDTGKGAVAPRFIEGAPGPLASPLKATEPAYSAYQDSAKITPSPASPMLSASPLKATIPAHPTYQEPKPRDTLPPPAPLTASTDSKATIVTPVSSKHKKTLLKPPRLLVTTEPDKGFRATFELRGETLTLGRAKDNDLYLPLAIISRYHAVFTRINSELQEPQFIKYKVVQCKSINPLCFKGKEVTEKVLEHGDTFEVGQRGFAEYVVKLTYLAAEYDSA
jgi:serine/threonine protein kinase